LGLKRRNMKADTGAGGAIILKLILHNEDVFFFCINVY
jgi:hypothetical protein